MLSLANRYNVPCDWGNLEPQLPSKEDFADDQWADIEWKVAGMCLWLSSIPILPLASLSLLSRSSRELPACGVIVDSRSGGFLRIFESLLSCPSPNLEQSALLANDRISIDHPPQRATCTPPTWGPICAQLLGGCYVRLFPDRKPTPNQSNGTTKRKLDEPINLLGFIGIILILWVRGNKDGLKAATA